MKQVVLKNEGLGGRRTQHTRHVCSGKCVDSLPHFGGHELLHNVT